MKILCFFFNMVDGVMIKNGMNLRIFVGLIIKIDVDKILLLNVGIEYFYSWMKNIRKEKVLFEELDVRGKNKKLFFIL